MSTLVVSWKEAAERKQSVFSEALVMPRMISSYWAVSPLAFLTSSLLREEVVAVDELARQVVGVALLVDADRFIIWRTISSMCLSLMSTPWDL